MALTSFIPEIWSAAVIRNLQRSSVLMGMTNRTWQDELNANGDKVHINKYTDPGDTAVKDYSRTAAITYDSVATTSQELIPDQEKYFAFEVEDISRMQNMGDALDRTVALTTRNLAIKVDSYIYGVILAGATNAALTGTNYNITGVASTSSMGVFNRLKRAAVAGYYPFSELQMVVGPKTIEKIGNYLSKLDSRVQYDIVLNDAFSDNGSGLFCTIEGMPIYATAAVTETSNLENNLIFSNYACAFIDQVDQVESLRRDTKFSTAIRGLYNYGAKVVEPNTIWKWNN